jgi:3-dehydroquinate dehydratase-2
MASTSTRRARRGADAGQRPRSILVLHGPNLNLLGTADPARWGAETLAEVDARLVAEAARRGVRLSAFQSNHDGALVDRVHAARDEGVDFVIVNPGSLAPEHVALRDALAATAIPYIAVDLANHCAEGPSAPRVRLHEHALGMIAGLGSRGYDFALAFALARMQG